MEVIKCGLCKEEIEYAQHCRVYIKTDEPRPFQRVSKRPHIGRYKLLSTAKSTEHISFARRLKRLRQLKKDISSSPSSNSSNSSVKEADLRRSPSVNEKGKRELVEETKPAEEKLIDCNTSTTVVEEPIEKTETENKTEEVKDKEVISPVESVIEINKKSEVVKENNPVEEVAVESNRNSKKRTTSKKDSEKDKMSRPQFQSSFEEYIKPSLSRNSSSISIGKDRRPQNSEVNTSDSEQSKMAQATSTPKSVKNGSTVSSKNSDCETYYWLEMPKPKQPELRKLGYQFDNLVAEVKHMKLPNTDWKIKIMVHKQEMVSVSFTKKLVPEKVVTVNAKTLVCDITVDGKKIVLLGSPLFIHSIKDLEIMLDIVNEVEPNSPMISYLKTLS